MQFSDLNLHPQLIQAVEQLGFISPMPVQEKVIPVLLENPRDLVGMAQTGTGKTAAFGLPILHHIDPKSKELQALILSPTRELCLQISRDLTNYSKLMPEIRTIAVYGGASIENQFKELKTNPHIVVATPGRLNDMIRRRKIDLSKLQWLVLDEADEMLDMGFQEEVDSILENTPDTKHTLLFSATMPQEIEVILNKYMRDPKLIVVGQKNTGTANVKHIYYHAHARDRYLVLKRIADYYPAIYAIVFCRTRVETQQVADSLIKDGYSADALHGDLSQAARENVMKRFRNKTLQMLVATDVAARGLDVHNLTHVINYNLPDDPEVYIHRSGRTGRADKTGISVSIVNLREKHKVKEIEKKIGREFALAKIPTGVQVCEKQLFHHINNMENVEIDPQIEAFLPVIYKKLGWMDKEEIIRRFVSLEFNRFLDYYRDARDLNVLEDHTTTRRKDFADKKDKKSSWRDAETGKRLPKSEQTGRYEALRFGIGAADGYDPKSIIGLINDATRSREISIGRIDIQQNFSMVEIDKRSVDKVLNAFYDQHRNPMDIQVRASGKTKNTREPKKKFYEDLPRKKKKK